MFVRFRQTAYRLQVSLVETRRIEGKVKHEHVASLGSIPDPPSTAERLAFWQKLHERLARLSNRVDAAKVLGEVHERIPMVTPGEQRALQLYNAKADEKFWGFLHEANADEAKGNKLLAADAERKALAAQVRATDAAGKVAAAQERLAKIERGEDVQGGLGKSMTIEDVVQAMRDAGWTDADFQHCRDLNTLDGWGLFEDYLATCNEARHKATKRIEHRLVRQMMRAHQQEQKKNLDARGPAPRSEGTNDANTNHGEG